MTGSPTQLCQKSDGKLADVRGTSTNLNKANKACSYGYLIEPDASSVSRKNKSCHPTSFTAHDERSPVVKWEVSRFEQVPIQDQQTSHPPCFKNTRNVRKKGDFRWTTEAEEAFTQLKQHIAALPTLVAPRPGEEFDSSNLSILCLYVQLVRVLLTDRDSVHTRRITSERKSTSRRNGINYSVQRGKANPGVVYLLPKDLRQIFVQARSEVKLQEPWILFTDGSSCVDGSGAGLILTNPEGMEFTYALRFEFTATNNEAEYEALIAGLRIAARMEDNMIQYLDKTKSLIQGFDRFTIRQVPRGDNKKADALRDTPFSLVYGTEAVIPAEIGMPTIRTAEVNIATNDDERRIDLDILEERREQAAIREEKAKLKMKGYYDAKVRGVSFRPGDFVYRANDASHAEDTGKLGPKWEGPYEVTEALGKGAYKLRDMDGRELPRTWNICNLKKCYL
ncbi:reverse transcriptase domain-containing protein [Tanacetum coccineum]|uniref:Reverse transcriptase domain-containing protein n=1 Tax=Tanacetum coccineum TaxID=301880 RepID=A0ABQ5G0D2_9ASTR